MLDEKGRITLPPAFREAWGLKPKQRLVLDYGKSAATLRPLGKLRVEDNPLLRELALHPLKGPKVSRRKLDKMSESLWSR